MAPSAASLCRLTTAPARWLSRTATFPVRALGGVGTRTFASIRNLTSTREGEKKKERVVILGSGWAGYALARTLDPAKFERIIVSPRSHFVFTPLLASTAVGTLEFRAVLEPVRRLAPVTFHQGWADDVDFARKTVRVEPSSGHDLAAHAVSAPAPSPSPAATKPPTTPTAQAQAQAQAEAGWLDVPYDKLVVAVGAYAQTFGIPGVRAHANFLRDVADARRIRLRVLARFEQCAAPHMSATRRAALLHFAVVGGGPTGIEFAAELHDLVHEDLAGLYPALVPLVRISVYDIAPSVLPMFERELAGYAMEVFRRQGIEVRTEHHLEEIGAGEGEEGPLRLRFRGHGDEEVQAGLVVWSTGLMQNPLMEKLANKAFQPSGAVGDGEPALVHLVKDARTGGIVTDGHLRARIESTGGDAEPSDGPAAHETLPDVFVIGDCAVVEATPSLPKTAQVASQQAAYLAKRLNKGRLDAPDAFAFRNWGTMAYLGSWRAVHQSRADDLRGRAAWVLWRTAYLTYSMSLRNKIMVPVYWAISWIFGRDISRF